MANIDVTLNPDLCQTLSDEGEGLEEKGHERSEDRSDYEQKNCKLPAILHTYPDCRVASKLVLSEQGPSQRPDPEMDFSKDPRGYSP